MAVSSFVVSLIFLLASYIQAGEALNCYTCTLFEESSSDNTTEARPKLLQKTNDASCKLNGKAFVATANKITSPCPSGSCMKASGEVSMKKDGVSSSMKAWVRYCGLIAEDECTTDLKYYEAALKARYGAQELSLSGTVCLCTTNKCNGVGRSTFSVICILLAAIQYMFF